jgi:hypothetical protein
MMESLLVQCVIFDTKGPLWQFSKRFCGIESGTDRVIHGLIAVIDCSIDTDVRRMMPSRLRTHTRRTWHEQ